MQNVILSATIPALIALVGVVITVIVGYKQTVKQIKQSNNELQEKINISEQQLKVEYITNKRIEWIQNVREKIAEFITIAMDYINYVESNNEPFKYNWSDEKQLRFYHNLNSYASMLRLYLNCFDKRDLEILSEIEAILKMVNTPKNEIDLSNYYEEIRRLIKLSQVYLKLEWERCKMEIEKGLQEAIIRDKKMRELEDVYRKALDLPKSSSGY